MKFLIDQNADFFGNELEKRNYEVEYILKLREQDPKFRNDLNMLKHAETNKMILVTKDRENGQACKDNGIPCIWLSDEELLENMILPRLDELKKFYD